MALTNEAEFRVASSIKTSLSSGKLVSINSARDPNPSNISSEVLLLPESKAKPASKTNPALTKITVCITDDDALENFRKRKKLR